MNTSNNSPNNRCKRKYKNQGQECNGLLVIETVEGIYCIKCINCCTYIFPPRREEEVPDLLKFSDNFACSKVV